MNVLVLIAVGFGLGIYFADYGTVRTVKREAGAAIELVNRALK